MAWWLRHSGDDDGLSFRPGGWVLLADLVARLRERWASIDAAALTEVVRSGNKPRYELDPSGQLIRARYGHSRDVDLQLVPKRPPRHLYHGTAATNVAAILREGLQARGRRSVHLSETVADAKEVGARHGRPSILIVDAAALAKDGYEFYRAASGVWLTDALPPQRLKVSGGP